jgi:hypothetical protein
MWLAVVHERVARDCWALDVHVDCRLTVEFGVTAAQGDVPVLTENSRLVKFSTYGFEQS